MDINVKNKKSVFSVESVYPYSDMQNFIYKRLG